MTELIAVGTDVVQSWLGLIGSPEVLARLVGYFELPATAVILLTDLERSAGDPQPSFGIYIMSLTNLGFEILKL